MDDRPVQKLASAHDPGRPRDLEERTRAYGREIFARVDRGGPFLLSPAWFDERLMEWTMGDEALKVQLFRFIDALPTLHSAAEVNRHLKEYLTEAEDQLSPLVRFGTRWLPRDGVLGGLLSRAARFNAERLARRFIAGSNVDEALATVARLRRRKLAFTVDLLGEATITEAESRHYQQQYFDLIEGLSAKVNTWEPVPRIDRDHQGPIPPVNVSVKLSSLYSQFDPIDPLGTSKIVRERLRPLLRAAQRHGVFVNIDMEQYAYKDVTLRIFKEVLDEDEFRAWPDVGIAIQAYLRDCLDDLRALADWAKARGTSVWVRLVKGAYWDYETVIAEQQGWPAPVFTRKWETDANYEACTRFLLEHYTLLRPAFGSHNIRSLAYALALADALGLPPGSIEIQMLYGMAEPFKEALVAMGQRVRVYTPYGQLLPGMAYLVRRLLENTANESFLRASFTENVPEEQLLMNPSHRDQGSGVRGQGSEVRGRDAKTDDGRGSVLSTQYSVLSTFRNDPLADFSREEARQALAQALAEGKTQLGQTYPPIINNQAVATAATIDSLNPSHAAQVVGRCGRATPAQAEQAVAAAHAAFPGWRDMPAEKRAAYLRKAANVMRRRRFELAAWALYECAKGWREADADIAEAIDFCDYYAQEAVKLWAPQHRDVAGEENAYFYEPRGVAVVIAPWNFPLAILTGMTAAALATGNTVVMKPAEQSAVIAAKLMEVFQEAGFPPGVVNYLPGDGEEVGPALVNHPHVGLIAFTGSRDVGLLINRQAAEMRPGQFHVKRVIAEMGGKNAVIVDDDADLDEAVHGVLWSAFGYQGQKCSACSRAVVVDGLHDRFLERMVEAARSLTVGPAEDPSSAVGPVIDEEARQRILRAIEKGKQEARLAFAADVGELAKEGCYVGPHIFADVSAGSSLAQEEIFGPVLAVLRARDLTHALEIANGTAYALTGGLYSRSPEHIARVRREFRVGNLYINRKITGALVDRQPFGGFKLSGIGSKAGGPDYLLQFVLPRTITENTMRRGFAPAAGHEGV